jgi:hypothetical protein
MDGAVRVAIGQADEMLRVYLNTFKPSAAACEHVAWICISFCPPLGDLVDGRGSSAELEALHGTAVPGVRDKSEDGEREPAQAETLEDRIDALLEEFEGIEGMCACIRRTRHVHACGFVCHWNGHLV